MGKNLLDGDVIPARILRQCECDVAKGETMTRMKSALYGAAALAIFAGGATAQPFMNMEDAATNASAIYEVDEDRDGRADRLIILEQSDSLA
jgi:hypothetical protein